MSAKIGILILMRGGEAADLVELRRRMADGSAKTLRESLCLGLGEAGSAAEVDPSTVWRWENNRRRPSGPPAIRYLRLLRRLERRQADVR